MRARASSENIALTASVRKEQMKNESLEQALQQKVTDALIFLNATSRRNFELAVTHRATYLPSSRAASHTCTSASASVCHRIRRSRNSPRSVMS